MKKNNSGSLPKITFFFRHINDLNFSMPLILFASDPRVIFYEELNENDRRVIELFKAGVSVENIQNPLIKCIFFISDIYAGFLNKVKLNKLKFFSIKYIEKIGLFFLNRNLLKIAKYNDLYRANIFAFDHTDSAKSRMLINSIRNHSPENQNPVVISLPHGANPFEGNMLSLDDYSPPKKADYSHFDHIICNDDQHFSAINGKKTQIQSLFYTKFWYEFMNKEINTSLKLHDASNKNINVLFVLSKFDGNSNVHLSEIIRCINILEQFQEISLKIKPHPRGLLEVKKLSAAFRNIDIVSGDVQEHINAADCIINIQSCVVFDAFLSNKPVIYPSFTTSNDLKQDIKDSINTANTPDEFYSIIRKLSYGEQLELPNYQFINWEDGLKNWINFFSSL